MASLRDVLQKYAAPSKAPSARAGADETNPSEVVSEQIIKIDRGAFQRDLEAVKRGNRAYFIVCVVMIVLLFMVSLIVVLSNLDKPDWIKVAMTVFGVSSAGLITVMINLWRTKSNTEFLLILAPNVDAETLRIIIEILARRL